MIGTPISDPDAEDDGRCPQCGEDEMDPSTCKYCGYPDYYRGWRVEQNWLGEYEATHPDFDPTPVHLYDGPSDNRSVTAKTRGDVCEEIDAWIEEHSA
jgi:hypothetical protein